MCVNYLLRISILFEHQHQIMHVCELPIENFNSVWTSAPVQWKWLFVWEVTVVMEVALGPGRSTPSAELSPWVGVQVWTEDTPASSHAMYW